MILRNVVMVLLAVVAIATLTAAMVSPDWNIARLVGMVAFAIVAVELLSRGGNPR